MMRGDDLVSSRAIREFRRGHQWHDEKNTIDFVDVVEKVAENDATKLFEKRDETRHPGGRPKIHAKRSDKDKAYRARKKQQLICPSISFTPLPVGPYRVIYADPPWQYRNDSYAYYGHAACQYPTLSIDRLCQLGVKSITEKRSVLFLWVTMPILFEVHPVIQAWGFTYKTGLIWDKERRNFGYYVGVQHELLLICTRGVCRPENKRLFESVQRIPPLGHSRKPAEFRLLIDALYPTGRRLELFAREHTDGWDAWGNELALPGEGINGKF
jgi:N6-adenosine-specific RNA methylase IME4